MDLLLKVDSIIEHYPDSALNLLKTITSHQELSKHDKAEYALLLTMAQDKNYIPHTSDSLIKIAVNYYKNTNNLSRIAKSYFYLGSVYRDLKNHPDATHAFLEALRSIPDGNESRLLFLIHYNLSEIYQKQAFYDKAIDSGKIAYKIASKQKKETDILSASRQLGFLFNFVYKPDSSLYYLEEALTITQQQGNKYSEGIIYSDIAKAYNEKGELHIAYQYLIKSLNIKETATTCFFLGKILNQLEQIDSARYYLLKCINDKNIYARAVSHNQLYYLEQKVGNYKEANLHNDEYLLLKDSINKAKKTLEMSKVISEDAVIIHTKNLAKEIDQNKIITIILFFSIILAMLLLNIFRLPKKKQNYNSRKTLERTKTILLNVKEIKRHIDTLKNNEHYHKILHIKNNAHKNDKILSAKERELLQTIICESFAELINGMRSEYPQLTNEDILCCILYISGCNNADVRILMGVENGALKSRKSRIKKKLDNNTFELIFKKYSVEN